MKKIMIAAMSAALSAAVSCSGTFSVTADIGSGDYDGVKVYMIMQYPADSGKNVILDSTVIENGEYSFVLEDVGEPCLVTFELEPKVKAEHYTEYYDLLPADCIASAGDIRIRYTPDGITAGGNSINDDFERMVLKPHREAHARSMAYRERTSLSDSIDIFYRQARPQYIEFVRKYAGTPAGAALFYSRSPEFYSEPLFEEINRSMAPEYAEAWKEKQESMRREIEGTDRARKAAAKGKNYIDFSSVTDSGQPVRLSDAVRPGRVLLVDFWASWCRPCRAEIPAIKQLYEKYHDAGLDIISVSMDTGEAAWRKAMEMEQMPWPQWSDLKGFKSEAALSYAVQAIPFIVLIGPDGKIALVNMHGEVLENTIRELLSDAVKSCRQ